MGVKWMEPIKIAIIDDSDFVRDGLKIILELDPDFEVVGVGGNGEEALKLVRNHRTDDILPAHNQM